VRFKTWQPRYSRVIISAVVGGETAWQRWFWSIVGEDFC